MWKENATSRSSTPASRGAERGELGRFIELLLKNNPNALEVLASPEDCVQLKHPAFDLLKPSSVVRPSAVMPWARSEEDKPVYSPNDGPTTAVRNSEDAEIDYEPRFHYHPDRCTLACYSGY